MVRRVLMGSYRAGRKLAIATIGASVVALGVAMLLLPGPAIIVIPLGLAVLAVEFAWARRWLERLRDGSLGVLGRSRNRAPAPRLRRSASRTQ
jgi:tellurite resistance protein TerC